MRDYPVLEDIPKEFYKNNKPPKTLEEATIKIERLKHSIEDISLQIQISGNASEKQLKALRVKKMQLRMEKEWVYYYYPDKFIEVCSD